MAHASGQRGRRRPADRVVQAAILVGFLHSTRPHSTSADRGFGDWNILEEAGWLLALLIVSVILVATALPASGSDTRWP